MSFTELPIAAVGLISNNRTTDSHWGKAETIESLLRVGRVWAGRYTTADTRGLQVMLNLFPSRFAPLTVDGLVGPKTRERVTEYQEQVGLPVNSDPFDAALRASLPKVLISIGQISRKSGGPFPPHASHRLGVDVDIRPIRSDLKDLPVTCEDKRNYNRTLTREVIRLVRDSARVGFVLFNDPVLIAEGLCRAYPGHSNHLHFRFDY